MCHYNQGLLFSVIKPLFNKYDIILVHSVSDTHTIVSELSDDVHARKLLIQMV